MCQECGHEWGSLSTPTVSGASSHLHAVSGSPVTSASLPCPPGEVLKSVTPPPGLSVGVLGLQSHATTSGFSCEFWRLNTEVKGFSPAIQVLGIKLRPAGPYVLSHFPGLAFNHYQILHMSVILILPLSMH